MTMKITNKTTIALVIPVYNEQARLSRTFSTINSWHIPTGFKLTKIIFVNDGSTDKSLELIRSSHLKYPKQIISYRTNRGKGHAVKRGMLASTSDYTLLVDADMSSPLDEFMKFIPLINKGFEIVIGTRKNGHSTVVRHQSLLRENMGKVFTLLSQIVLCVDVTDFTCGFKLFSRNAKNKIFKRSHITRWGYDSEILFLANKLGLSLTEKAVIWANQKGSKVNLIKDTLISLKELVQIRTNYFNGVYKVNQNKSPDREAILIS